METTMQFLGLFLLVVLEFRLYTGIMENSMEPTIVYGVYILG